MAHPIAPPAQDEYAPFYAGYVDRVAGHDLRALLERQLEGIRSLIAPLPDAEGAARYEPGKWSVKEVLGHIADTERVMSYRLLRIARGDATPLPGFEQDAYVAAAHSDTRTLESLLAELEAVRASTLALVESLGPEAWVRRGVASGREVSARALAHIIAGHLEHHAAILRERYGLGTRE
jgi:hypothetical protein